MADNRQIVEILEEKSERNQRCEILSKIITFFLPPNVIPDCFFRPIVVLDEVSI